MFAVWLVIKLTSAANVKGEGPAPPGQYKGRKAVANVAVVNTSTDGVKMVDPS